ncbi:hypothetical protein BDA96_02G358400 [Sorghum bicolor]|uniref:Uncharacterized protein n=2 Tax=Sorghum bicolor TaxID=4558 RepID=A0A921RSP9_SORBI|nr:uncharacterized protein LOC8081763 [Sorghum bicolor]KAG0545401.1 hypothetical protein BDA96_02G358400 [Sorghum bicolor]KXG36496.1 hypothetical protein SORBI_3002G341900 [Sorghum bicolor]|eukprot:XP_002463037.2 uncharacterized protein LOC8081763 [Sorghum bicolor]
MMSSRAASASAAAVAGGEHRRQHATVGYGGLPRPIRPVLGEAGPRPGTPRPGGPAPAAAAAGGSRSSPSGRVERSECNWWGAGARQHQQATAAAPRRPRSSRGAGACARVPTGKGNRELVRRALAPPAARGRGRGGPVLMRKWSFRPAPSRLRNASASSLSSHSQSPASPRPRPS